MIQRSRLRVRLLPGPRGLRLWLLKRTYPGLRLWLLKRTHPARRRFMHHGTTPWMKEMRRIIRLTALRAMPVKAIAERSRFLPSANARCLVAQLCLGWDGGLFCSDSTTCCTAVRNLDESGRAGFEVPVCGLSCLKYITSPPLVLVYVLIIYCLPRAVWVGTG